MQLTWLGHSCVLLKGSRSILIDPFIPSGEAPPETDLVAVTHGHNDHFGATKSLSGTVVAIKEIGNYLDRCGQKTVSMNIGGTAEVEGVRFTMTPALHSSCLEAEGVNVYGGAAAGFVIGMDGLRVYHAGDTALFSDMKLIRDLYRPDVALLPIGGHYTMGPQEAMMAANFIGAGLVIPIHYNTWPVIAQDAGAFRQALERTTDIRVAVLSPGESIDLEKELKRA
jgi:L-ascorbate metabolism protein UlaG (beta-lactamase superfamily)